MIDTQINKQQITNITLYTLPTCSICKMIKTKLNQKNIKYIEDDFSNIAELIKSDRAPALFLEQEGQKIILKSPTDIVEWINNYQE